MPQSAVLTRDLNNASIVYDDAIGGLVNELLSRATRPGFQEVFIGHGAIEDIIMATALSMRNQGLPEDLTRRSLLPFLAAMRQYEEKNGTGNINAKIGVLPRGMRTSTVAGDAELMGVFLPGDGSVSEKIEMGFPVRHSNYLGGGGNQNAPEFAGRDVDGVVFFAARPVKNNADGLRNKNSAEQKPEEENGLTPEEIAQMIASAEWKKDPRFAAMIIDYEAELDRILGASDFTAKAEAALARIDHEGVSFEPSQTEMAKKLSSGIAADLQDIEAKHSTPAQQAPAPRDPLQQLEKARTPDETRRLRRQPAGLNRLSPTPREPANKNEAPAVQKQQPVSLRPKEGKALKRTVDEKNKTPAPDEQALTAEQGKALKVVLQSKLEKIASDDKAGRQELQKLIEGLERGTVTLKALRDHEAVKGDPEIAQGFERIVERASESKTELRGEVSPETSALELETPGGQKLVSEEALKKILAALDGDASQAEIAAVLNEVNALTLKAVASALDSLDENALDGAVLDAEKLALYQSLQARLSEHEAGQLDQEAIAELVRELPELHEKLEEVFAKLPEAEQLKLAEAVLELSKADNALAADKAELLDAAKQDLSQDLKQLLQQDSELLARLDEKLLAGLEEKAGLKTETVPAAQLEKPETPMERFARTGQLDGVNLGDILTRPDLMALAFVQNILRDKGLLQNPDNEAQNTIQNPALQIMQDGSALQEQTVRAEEQKLLQENRQDQIKLQAETLRQEAHHQEAARLQEQQRQDQLRQEQLQHDARMREEQAAREAQESYQRQAQIQGHKLYNQADLMPVHQDRTILQRPESVIETRYDGSVETGPAPVILVVPPTILELADNGNGRNPVITVLDSPNDYHSEAAPEKPGRGDPVAEIVIKTQEVITEAFKEEPENPNSYVEPKNPGNNPLPCGQPKCPCDMPCSLVQDTAFRTAEEQRREIGDITDLDVDVSAFGNHDYSPQPTVVPADSLPCGQPKCPCDMPCSLVQDTVLRTAEEQRREIGDVTDLNIDITGINTIVEPTSASPYAGTGIGIGANGNKSDEDKRDLSVNPNPADIVSVPTITITPPPSQEISINIGGFSPQPIPLNLP